MPPIIHLQLRVAELDQILSILQEVNLPYKVTNPLIQTLLAQANDLNLNPKEISVEPT